MDLENAAYQSPLETSAVSVIQRALRSVRAHLEMDVAYLSEFVDDMWVCRAVDCASGKPPFEVGDLLEKKETYCFNVSAGNMPPLLPDTRENGLAMSLGPTHDLNIACHVAIPIRREDGSTYGSFCCLSTRPKPELSEEALAVAEMFATFAADQIEGALQTEQRREAIIERISSKLVDGGIRVLYQPIVDVDTMQISSFEALARFDSDPYRPPDAWFAEAHLVGLGCDLEIAAIDSALSALNVLPCDVGVTVNASADTIVSGELVPLFQKFPTDRITLELTEHTLAENAETLIEHLNEIKLLGVKLAIDDVGSGYANLAQIVQLSPHVIKLDRSLVSNIHNTPNQQSLTRAIIQFAHDTNTLVVAEGVETKHELDQIRDLGAHKLQGWFLGKPMSIDDACAEVNADAPGARAAS